MIRRQKIPENFSGILSLIRLFGCRNGNIALVIRVDGTVEMIGDAVFAYDPRFMCVDVFPIVLRLDQRLAVPDVPVDQIAGAGKGIVSRFCLKSIV